MLLPPVPELVVLVSSAVVVGKFDVLVVVVLEVVVGVGLDAFEVGGGDGGGGGAALRL
jgi:hypothetical protein